MIEINKIEINIMIYEKDECSINQDNDLWRTSIKHKWK